MNFNYKALNTKGEQIDGVISSASEVVAIQTLRGQGLYPVQIKKTEELPFCGYFTAENPKKSLAKFLIFAILFLVGVVVGAILTTF